MSLVVQNHYSAKMPYITADNNPQGYSWFGRAWRNAAIAIFNHKEEILNAVGGGVLGSIVAALLDKGVDVTVQGREMTTIDVGAEEFDGLTETESKTLNTWLKISLAPSINALIRQFDININVNRTGIISNTASEIMTINSVLRKIYTMQAYAKVLEQKGERRGITNYTKQKAILVNKIVEYVEKAIIIYVKDNVSGFKMVEETNVFGNNITIEGLFLDFQNTKVNQKVKSFVRESQTNLPTQTDVDIVSTDINDDMPATSTTHDGTQFPTEPAQVKKGFKLFTIGWISLAAIVGYKAFKSNKK